MMLLLNGKEAKTVMSRPDHDFQTETEEPFSAEDTDSEVSVEDVLGSGEKEVYTTLSDPDVKTLLGRIEDRSLILQPKFQRASVWDDKRKSRLIESLLLNLPIPPCFLAEDEDGTRVVVDGQQRLIAIDDFCHGRYALTGLEVLSHLNKKTWKTLPPKLDRKILQRVIRTLIISHHTDPDLRFIIFERLNTGAVPLVDQEIRNATMGGPFNDLLDELANSALFLELMRISKPDSRLRHHELILRFFAIENSLSNYKPPLKLLLTKYMREARKPSSEHVEFLRSKFIAGLTNSKDIFGTNAFRKFSPTSSIYERAVSRALFVLQMITLHELTPEQVADNKTEIEAAFKRLFSNQDFVESLSRATDHRSRFYLRQRVWIEALNSIGIRLTALDRLPPLEE